MPVGDNSEKWHRLRVIDVCSETSDAKSFVFEAQVDPALFAFEAGQFLTFKVPCEDGLFIERSYSLSRAPTEKDPLRVCVKRVPDGIGSNWFNSYVKAGQELEAKRPAGRFTLKRGRNNPVILIAGGSGITPCLSLAKSLVSSTMRRVKMLYANRTRTNIIYGSELMCLEREAGERFKMKRWIDEDVGYLQESDLERVLADWTDADAYICGPAPFMDLAENVLDRFLIASSEIHLERFTAEPAPESHAAPDAMNAVPFKVTLDDEEFDIPLTAGQTLLEAGLAAGVDMPSSCSEGNCGSCMAILRSGDVAMASDAALSRRNKERGYVLACQAKATSGDPIWLDYDS